MFPPGILCRSSCCRLGRYTLLEVKFPLVLSDVIIRVIRVIAVIDLAVRNVCPLVGVHVASPLEVVRALAKDKLGDLSDKQAAIACS
jgi:hypothetical protein